jgi:SAM-dependent methyltransferase
MQPFGRGLRAFFEGQQDAVHILHRDDGLPQPIPIAVFFRDAAEFTEQELDALDRCRGHVLDIGAGAGIHSLELEARGLTVTAIDVDPDAVAIMISRGLEDVRLADVFEFDAGPFDTLLLLGHGIGMVGTLAGLDRFFRYAPTLTATGGQILLNSVDVRMTEDPKHLAYHERNRKAGVYEGVIAMEIEFDGERGAPFTWLHVDFETMATAADRAGWDAELLQQDPTGEYLARLVRKAV